MVFIYIKICTPHPSMAPGSRYSLGMQETSYYTDKFSSIPSSTYLSPYNPPTAAKAQQDPQLP